MRVVALLLPLTLIACSERSSAPAAPGCIPGQPCGPGNPIGGGGSDGGNDDGGESGATDGGVTVTATVFALNEYPDDPTSASTAPLTNVALRANRFGGGVIDVNMVDAENRYILPDVAGSATQPTWIQILRAGVVVAISGIGASASDTYALPLFSDELPLETWNANAIGLGAYPSDSNPSTIVVHVHDRDGARRAGVVAAPYGSAAGPYYDDGATIGPEGNETGARGTIVFLGVVGTSTFGLTLKSGATTYDTINVPVSPNAVSHVALRLD